MIFKEKLAKLKLFTILGFCFPLAFVSSCSLFSHDNGIRSSLQFDNYELYINDENKDILNKYYHYNEFGDLPDFERDIDNGISVGGVGSDYFSAKLAEEGKIRKLDFNKIFGISADRTKWYHDLLNLYTPEVWSVLNSFTLHKRNNNGQILYRTNQNGTKWSPIYDPSKTYYTKNGLIAKTQEEATSQDVTGDGYDDKLWEFIVPYFLQSKVVAFNPYSFKGNSPDIAKLKSAKNQKDVDNIFQSSKIYQQNPIYSYNNILSWLRSIGASSLTINDYMRDNVSIGAEGINGSSLNKKISNYSEGKKYLDQFKNIIDVSWKSKGGKVRPFDTNGTKVLMALNQVKNQEKGLTDVAIMYNGDALDAYQAGEWDNNYLLPNSKGQIRVLMPKKSGWFLDTVVMSKKTSNSIVEQDRFYNAIRNALFGFADTDDSLPDYGVNINNMLLKNLNLVQYTPTYKYLYDYVTNAKYDYFGGDQMALGILTTSKITRSLSYNVISNNDRIKLTDYDQKIGRDLEG